MTPSPEFDEMKRHFDVLENHSSLHATDQGALLKMLLDLKDPGSQIYGRKFSSTDYFFEYFYQQVLFRQGAANSGQQMVSNLNTQVLPRAYKNSFLARETKRRLLVRKSSPGGYELGWTAEWPSSDGSSSGIVEDLHHLGTIETAMQEYVKLVRQAIKVEDTAVRWSKSQTSYLYSAEAIHQLQLALKGNPGVEFRSITSPIVERQYMEAIAGAFVGREKQLICRRLPQATPLMNFAIFYFPDGKRKVLFGYGKQDGNVGQTAVFSSANPALVKEFQRLYQILEKSEISRQIMPVDPEFSVQRSYSNEILATFAHWPESEIIDRITNCRRHISICTAGWSSLGLYQQCLTKALRKSVPIRIGIWDAETSFVRAMSELRNLGAFDVIIAGNEAVLGHIKKSVSPASLEVKRLKGWGSAPMMWIDDYLYVGGYWNQGSAYLGPAYLIREPVDISEKTTASYLVKEFEAMMADAVSI